MTSLSISQPQYFPWPGLMEQVSISDTFVHYSDVDFARGLFNRVKIKSPTGPVWLTVPLEDYHQGQKINQVRVRPTHEWLPKHRLSLELNYKHSPHYLEMITLFEDSVFSVQSDKRLSEISIASTEKLVKYFDLDKDVKLLDSSGLCSKQKGSQRILEICKELGADSYITGHGASNYLDHQRFEDEKIDVWYMEYSRTEYPQRFGEFHPFLSSLDLVANLGLNGRTALRASCIPWRDFMNRKQEEKS